MIDFLVRLSTSNFWSVVILIAGIAFWIYFVLIPDSKAVKELEKMRAKESKQRAEQRKNTVIPISPKELAFLLASRLTDRPPSWLHENASLPGSIQPIGTGLFSAIGIPRDYNNDEHAGICLICRKQSNGIEDIRIELSCDVLKWEDSRLGTPLLIRTWNPEIVDLVSKNVPYFDCVARGTSYYAPWQQYRIIFSRSPLVFALKEKSFDTAIDSVVHAIQLIAQGISENIKLRKRDNWY